MVSRYAVLALLTCAGALAQMPSPPKNLPPPWVVLVDPVCPVSGFYQNPFPNTTREMRIMYFPRAKAAKFKDPQSLTLQLAFNHPQERSSVVVPFSRKEDYWEAVVPLDKWHAMYAIFSVKDENTNQVDDNGGQFWDVVFCDANGTQDVNGVLRQAESHTGVSWPLGLRRPKDYGKAVAVLEGAVAADGRYFPVEQLWRFKAERDGGDAKAWANVSRQVAQFMVNHIDDRNMPTAVSNFVVENYDKLPDDFIEQAVRAIDAKRNDPKSSLRAQLEYRRAVMERDPGKRLGALDTFLARYPRSFEAVLAQQTRFFTLAEIGDVAGAEAAFAKYRDEVSKSNFRDFNAHYDYLTLARLYIQKRTKLPDALKLIGQAEASLKAYEASEGRKFPKELQKSVDAECAQLRARVYLAMRKPELALSEAKKALESRDSAESHFMLGQALAASGDSKKAMDEYFEAALLPSNEDLHYGEELRNYYIRKRFGNERQFEAELQKRKTGRFQASSYVPKLVDRDAPVFEFVTLKGENFDAAALSGKTLIVNFWSPG